MCGLALAVGSCRCRGSWLLVRLVIDVFMIMSNEMEDRSGFGFVLAYGHI